MSYDCLHITVVDGMISFESLIELLYPSNAAAAHLPTIASRLLLGQPTIDVSPGPLNGQPTTLCSDRGRTEVGRQGSVF